VDLSHREAAARSRLDPMWFDYLAGGAGEERAVAANRDAWTSLSLRPSYLRDVRGTSAATTLLGRGTAAPIVVAPTAMHRLFHADGERATALGAAEAGLTYAVSMCATTALEELAAVAPGAPRWMQLYMQADRAITKECCERAAEAGYEALVLTVDSPVTARNLRNERNGFNVPAWCTLPNIAPRREHDLDIWAIVGAYDAAVTPDDIGLVSSWAGGLPVVVKGLVRGDDARRAVDAGAAAVAVSNHGGRQLDTCIATARALPEVVDAVAGDAEVYVDGGIRSGVDVVKALALGARAVMVGRPVLWGLATDGAAGVQAVLAELAADTVRTLALCGVTSPLDVTPDLVC
jgi:4-hydroxymandelate oxidase